MYRISGNTIKGGSMSLYIDENNRIYCSNCGTYIIPQPDGTNVDLEQDEYCEECLLAHEEDGIELEVYTEGF